MLNQSQSKQALSEESIHQLVYRFYDQVRADDVLGPVFEEILHGKWDNHLPRMVDFWSSILLGSSRFQGNVYGKHMALSGITAEHFVRWLSMFEDTSKQLFDEPTSDEIMLVARRIAGSLQLGFFGQRVV